MSEPSKSSTSDTTFEEAKRCPKCTHPGEDFMTRPAPREANLPKGTTIHTIYCRHEPCPWYNTCWMVQVNADGSVPPPKNLRSAHEPKIYQGFEGHDEMAAQIRRQVEAAALLETQEGGYETRGR